MVPHRLREVGRRFVVVALLALVLLIAQKAVAQVTFFDSTLLAHCASRMPMFPLPIRVMIPFFLLLACAAMPKVSTAINARLRSLWEKQLVEMEVTFLATLALRECNLPVSSQAFDERLAYGIQIMTVQGNAGVVLHAAC